MPEEPVSEEWISWSLLDYAYRDFLRHKRSKDSAYQYMQIALSDLRLLRDELNYQTYEIGETDAFCVTRPTLREVFVAKPRDRVIHHLLVGVFMPMFEEHSIEHSYNCRKNKGTSGMYRRMKEMIDAVPDGYIMSLDVKSCFVSIDKDILWSMLQPALNAYMDTHPKLARHRDEWLSLWKIVVYHRPELNCRKRGNTALFDLLPEGKSLFKSNGRGLAIGNLSSQILANFYFALFDHHLLTHCAHYNIHYARYMDDMIFTSNNKRALLLTINVVRTELFHLNMRLSDHKIHIQRSFQSFSAIGRTFCRGRVYISNRTVHNAFRTIRHINMLIADGSLIPIRRAVAKINSYYGFMHDSKSYGIRWRMWNEISVKLKKCIYSKRMRSVHIRKVAAKKYGMSAPSH